MRFLPQITIAFFLALMPFQATALLLAQVGDGNPWDRLILTNHGCPLLNATVTLDMRTSANGVVFDTEYGGIGTQDPMPVELLEGNATLVPVLDGEQVLTLHINLMPEGSQVIVTFDLDDTKSAERFQRIEVFGHEVAGSVLTLAHGGQNHTAEFSASGFAAIKSESYADGCLIG